MKTTLWTVLAFACGFLTLASFTGVIAGFRTSLLDVALAGVLTFAFGAATRGSWRKARGPRTWKLPGPRNVRIGLGGARGSR